MDYPPPVKRLLESAGAGPGDIVEVKGDGWDRMGTVMPYHAFSSGDILILKLANGYNTGIGTDGIRELALVSKGEEKTGTRLPARVRDENPTVAILGTGGTIASYVDYRTGAVHPAVTVDELVFSVPEILESCNVRGKTLFRMFSENMTVEHWATIADEAGRELNDGARAVIVPHGTDTMHVTSAALGFMMQNLTGPVVLVGSQRSSDRPSSDAAMNLLCATRLAEADLGEVVVVMHGSVSDEGCAIHRGTKVRKMHSSRRDAFRSVNQMPIGRVGADGTVELSEGARPRRHGKVTVDPRMDPDVALVKFHLGLKPDVLSEILRKSSGMVMEGSGLGHVASNLIPVIEDAIENGKPVVVTTQCLYGRVGLKVYETGRDMLEAGVISGEDMLPEVATLKLMWALGHTKDMGEISKMIRTDIAGEINPSIGLEGYDRT